MSVLDHKMGENGSLTSSIIVEGWAFVRRLCFMGSVIGMGIVVKYGKDGI